ncbi:MAG: hypothetical protein CBC83_02265 [Flavobacteriales bacterium TMED123]|nr:hypothetical protein [Candidatus Neomarinimicrobiota bacterium]MAJ44506.1 hypothetical protein [Candidatus Neomarinimicrobiota bacterium]OUV73942.1 MAG: hypothetical protein CBC83_04710 [Flavobacteriales bacterium TMED123]OUV75583.1 MAG: hypothetical protein CBC83_02265 [Flavobacteriales bacterium TMED123]|tara:strand:+ start:1306 stop:1641 length:336 start_codon:yes stop_codon:yes gene_type:complete
MTNKIEDLKDEDFAIRIRPFLNKEGNWEGDVSIGLITSSENPLQDEDFSYIIHLCSMMSAVVPVCEEDEYIRNKLHKYVISEIERDEEEPLYYTEGNLITLNKNTKTKGNA